MVDPVRAKFLMVQYTELEKVKIKNFTQIRVCITCVWSDACAEPSSVDWSGRQLRQFSVCIVDEQTRRSVFQKSRS